MGKDLENTKLITTLTSSYGIDPAFTQSVDFAQHRVNKIWNSTEKIFAVKVWSTRDGKDYVLLCMRLHCSKLIFYSFQQFNCCGVQLDADYDRSEWRKQSLGGIDLRYPWTCCPLNATLSDPPAFMNPVPQNASECQMPAVPNTKTHRYREASTEKSTWTIHNELAKVLS